MALPEIGGNGEGKARMPYIWDGTKWVAVLGDSAGHPQVDIISSALPTDAATEPTLASILAQLDVALSTRALESGGNLAAIKTALEKIDDFADVGNLIFGYNDRLFENLGGTKSGAGTYTEAATTVLPGYIHVLQRAWVFNETDGRGRVYIELFDGSDWYTVETYLAGDRREVCEIHTPITLKAGDNVRVRQYLCQNGDVIMAGIWGYKMKVA